MCRSKSDGGRRCARTPYKKSRASLLRKGDADAVERLNEAHALYGDDVRHLSMNIPEAMERLLDDLQTLGKPLIVGGSVRDACLGASNPKDIDIEMHGTEGYGALARGLRRQGYRVDEVGKAFGVLKTTLRDGTDIDISLPRRDNRVGAGHRGFEVEVDSSMTLSEAAARRDFTLNAMYYDHATQALVDPHHGYDDLRNKVLRHVSDAYTEDPLRVLRGVQMCARFNMSMHEDTVEASRSMIDQFHDLPQERIQEEWHKFFTRGKNFSQGLEVLRRTGWDEPMGISSSGIMANELETVIRKARKQGMNPTVLGAALMLSHVEEGEREEVSRRLVIGSRNQNTARRLSGVQESTPRTAEDVRRLARRLDKDSLTVKEWATLHDNRAAIRLSKAHRCYEGPVEDVITGRDMLSHSGRSGGRWVGEALRAMQDQQDSGQLTSKEEAFRWLDDYLSLHA